MELLSNLTWIAVATALWGLWLVRRRQPRHPSLLPGLGIQLVGLAVLTAILLPVISITDDLQAAHNPAEVERSVARSERHLNPDFSSPSLPVAWALLAAGHTPQRPRRIAFLAADISVPPQAPTGLRSLQSRPPPAS